MSRILATLTAEGFVCQIVEGEDRVVRFKADADIDADGANGQNGAKGAYRSDNQGSEALANGGMGIRNGKVVFVASWGPDISLVGDDGHPLVLPNGVIPTKTAYYLRGHNRKDPAAYIDSETVPYVVVPPLIIAGVRGIVKGCQAFATYRGKRVAAVVADVGPRAKIGEVSIDLARRLGIPHSPRSGGTNSAAIDYEIMPGVPAAVLGKSYELMPSAGWA